MSNEPLKVELYEAFRRSPGKPLVIHHCSICGYPCHYFSIGDALAYNSGCDCIRGRYEITARDWNELDFYLDPRHGHLEKIKEFIEESKAGAPQ